MKNKITRRKIIKDSIKMAIVLPAIGVNLFSCTSNEPKDVAKQKKGLKILILGGTSFLGPHQIAYAISRGHSISIFTRGKTKPTVHTELFDQVEHLIGDRENDLSALENGQWDAVIDNSGHNVNWTKKSAELLKDKVDLYLYTSSTGVYYPYLDDNITEDKELLLKEPENIEDEEEKIEYWYGVMKTNSEIAAKNIFGENQSIIVRPTYMIGPADKSNRFIHWPIRLARGGEIMIPGKSDDLAQYIDVRDVAEFMIRLIEEKKTGTYNAVGPKSPETMHEFIEKAKRAFDVKSEFVYINDYNFLKENGISHAVPWIPPVGKNYGSARINNKKGLAAGLTIRGLKTSLKDTYNWWYSDAVSSKKRDEYENNPESLLMREKSIIENWRNKKQ